jgi:hypothetical protein
MKQANTSDTSLPIHGGKDKKNVRTFKPYAYRVGYFSLQPSAFILELTGSGNNL